MELSFGSFTNLFMKNFVEANSYKEFIDRYKIYYDWKEAQCKGYEAHHIIPRSLGGTDADGLVRLTPFEHLYAHYLFSKENKEHSDIFYCMFSIYGNKLTDIENITLKDLEEFSLIRERGSKKRGKEISIALKGHPVSEETRNKLSIANIGHHPNNETRQKMSESHKGVSLSEEHKKNIGISSRGHRMSDESKKRISIKNKGNKSRTGYKNSEEHNKRISKSNKGKVRSDETKQKLSEIMKKKYEDNPELREKMKLNTKRFFESEEGKELRKRLADEKRGKPGTPHSDEWKKYMSNRKKLLSKMFKKLKEDGIYTLSWNEFQSWLKKNRDYILDFNLSDEEKFLIKDFI